MTTTRAGAATPRFAPPTGPASGAKMAAVPTNHSSRRLGRWVGVLYLLSGPVTLALFIVMTVGIGLIPLTVGVGMLDLWPDGDDNRRVLAVLEYLRAAS